MTTLSAETERRYQRIIDYGERIFFLVLFANLVVRISPGLSESPANGIVLVSEGLVVLFVMFRRQAVAVTTRPLDWLIAFTGATLPLLVAPGATPAVAPVIGAAIMTLGLYINIWSKLTLRRSFGLAAANRGLVHAGPYGFVRHPMYAGYTLVYVGFLLNNPVPENFLVYGVTFLLFLVRMRHEEKVLARDPDYAAFMHRVRHRLIPSVY